MENKDLRNIFFMNDFSKENLPLLVNDLSKICKFDISSNQVYFLLKNLSNSDKVRLDLVSRFIANRIDSSISPDATPLEISKSVRIPSSRVSARLSESRQRALVRTGSKGRHSINPLKIKDIIKEVLDNNGH